MCAPSSSFFSRADEVFKIILAFLSLEDKDSDGKEKKSKSKEKDKKKEPASMFQINEDKKSKKKGDSIFGDSIFDIDKLSNCLFTLPNIYHVASI